MRFLYIDRMTRVERGKSISGTKTFPLSEAYLKGHFSKAPLIPGSLLIEAMAQIAGWLVVYSYDFKTSCVISIMEEVRVPAGLRPGAAVQVHGEMTDTNRRGSLCRAWVEQDGETIAEGGRLVFSHFKTKDPAWLIQQFRCHGWLDGEVALALPAPPGGSP